MPFLVHLCTPSDVMNIKMIPGHTLSYTVSKFEVNPTDGSRVIDNFVHPL